MKKYKTKKVPQEEWDSYILEILLANPQRLLVNFSREMSPNSFSRTTKDIKAVVSMMEEEFGEISTYSLAARPPYFQFRSPIEISVENKPWQLDKRGLFTLDYLTLPNDTPLPASEGLEISLWDNDLTKRKAIARFVKESDAWMLVFLTDDFFNLQEAQWRWFGQLVQEAKKILKK